ncbi:MAG: PAS domain-containing protein [Candidatus Dormiibacterota bacterium]
MPRVERRDPRRTASRRQTGGGRRSTDFSLEAAVLNSDLNLILGSVVETVAEGICILDRKSLVRFANREAERILGVSRQAMIGRAIIDLTKESLGRDGKPAGATNRPSLMAMQQNRPVYGIQLSFLRPDGTRIHLSCNAAPLRDASGKVTGAVVSLRDITEQVLAGEELAAMGHARRHLIDRLVSAQEEERRRIAADMHDDSLQVMGAISLRLARVRQRTHDQGTQEAMDELQGTVELAATRLRHLLFNLRPPVLDREGVAAALRGYLERMRDDAGVHYRLHDRLAAEPSLERRTQLFRIAQEALVNVRKHAGASRVDVSLDSRWGGSLLTVRDDGKGFAVDARRRPDSLGLLAMSERAEMMGGWCEVQSAEGEGTRVRVWLPDPAQERTA